MTTQTEHLLVTEDQARHLVPEAIAGAMDKLTAEGYRRDDIYKAAMCAKLAALAVRELGPYGAKQETHIGSDLTTHDYLVIETTGNDIVADGTWQQFLPQHLRKADLPKVLVGTRDEVALDALRYGVDKGKIELWDERSKRDREKQRLADAEAELAADSAEKAGNWEVFRSKDKYGRDRKYRVRGGLLAR